MRADRVTQLADFIEAGSRPWGIVDTETCYFGQARAMAGEKAYDNLDKFLGIDQQALITLVSPFGYYQDGMNGRYPRERAVAVLRNLARTGEVDSSIQAPRHEVLT